MTTFLQLHVLTTYPAANLNRDDTGRPKTLIFGGAERLRVSSQSLKRALRTSDLFCERIGGKPGATDGNIGTRSNTFTAALVKALQTRNMPDDDIEKKVGAVIEKAKLGKPKKEKIIYTEQLVHLSPEELARLENLADRLMAGDELAEKEAVVLVAKPRAADIALFGRMLADNPGYNVEAACQVAHAFTTHKATVEDDFYTAVDDLKNADRDADRGAGFMGVMEHGSGVFYLYICLDASLLVRNLAGDVDLAIKTGCALIEAAAMVSPKGKQNSYASRAYADFALLETGTHAPRTLAAAFIKPVGVDRENDYGAASKKRLIALRGQFDAAYGKPDNRGEKIVDVSGDTEGKVSLAELLALAEEAIKHAA